MTRVLVLFAHADPGRSHANRAMLGAAHALEGVTVVDLYAEYPRFEIDIATEQQRLVEHDVVVLQFPVFWYSVPALLKEWQDVVLEYGFAYGEGGDRLAGKRLLVACSAGGSEEAYSTDGKNRFPLRTLLTPLEQTANLCRMDYLPPFVLFSSMRAVKEGDLDRHVDRYRRLLTMLRDDELVLESRDGASLFEHEILEGDRTT